MRRPRLTLASEILSLQLVIILGALVVGVAASLWVAARHLDDEYGQRALSIAKSVSAVPAVTSALDGSGPKNAVQPLAERVRTSSGATFIVVMDAAGERLSHPNPALLGQRVDDFGAAMDGRAWIGHDNGSLGPSVRAKAPVFGGSGQVIGVVSVGFREDLVQAALTSELPAVGITLGSALALAALGSFLLARRLKRKTFGLEPDEIGRVLEQREAILHGIREGTVAADLRGRITLVNDEARDLLGLDATCVGRPVDDALPGGRIRDMLSEGSAGIDEIVVNGDRVLVANCMPVAARGGVIGYVVTLRDRTEIEGALRELDSVRGMSDALRAQAHEFSNHLHTLAGLIEMGRTDEALRLIDAERTSQQELAAGVARQVNHPILGALLLSKSVVAAERGIDFQLSADTDVGGDLGDARSLVTIAGNLVDNAFDAVAALPHNAVRSVQLSMRIEANLLAIDVRDSGAGIDPALGAAIFDEGVTSKSANGRQRGLGLSLVRHAVQRRGGVIDVVNDGGALFRVRLPLPAAPAAAEAEVAAAELSVPVHPSR
ncbi:MAG TPA: sensor histidine kinase [Candidatus Dormibacteraeota bacterium]|nr:sensor histidine kinase [Candidatus Dormibacteraeota bacterium]